MNTPVTLLACALLMATSSHASQRSTAIIDDAAYTRAHRLVAVDGKRRLNLYCTGAGSPTVLFDSGLGGNTIQWGLVQPLVAARTRACSYDLAGLGFSDASTRPGTSANAVDDRYRLLKAARLPPPYVLMGASYGGMNVRLFAYTYPGEVAGLVLVDPSHEDLGIRIWQLQPDFETKYLPYMQSLQQCFEALRDAKNAIWAALHEQIAHESSRGQRRVVAEPGHLIALDRPDAVAPAVLDVLH